MQKGKGGKTKKENITKTGAGLREKGNGTNKKKEESAARVVKRTAISQRGKKEVIRVAKNLRPDGAKRKKGAENISRGGLQEKRKGKKVTRCELKCETSKGTSRRGEVKRPAHSGQLCKKGRKKLGYEKRSGNRG